MSPQEFLNTYQGQSLLYSPSPAREYLRGQCVMAACFYVVANNLPVIWADASIWYTGNAHPDKYQRIPFSASSRPHTGDLIVWGSNLPNSGGAGHIAICISASDNSFVSVEQNWGGKYVHAVTHNYSYVIGWLRPIKNQGEQNMPTIATQDMVDSLAHAYLNDSIAANPGLQTYIGQPVESVIATFNTAPERAHYLKNIELLSTTINDPNQTITPKVNWQDIIDFKAKFGLEINEGDKGFVGYDWKSFQAAILNGEEFKNIEYVNDGDIANLAFTLPGTDVSNTKGTLWRTVFYTYIMPTFKTINTALAKAQTTINKQNTTITTLNQELQSTTLTAKQKQQAVQDAMDKLAAQNSSLTTTHDELVSTVQPFVGTPKYKQTKATSTSILVRLVALLLPNKK